MTTGNPKPPALAPVTLLQSGAVAVAVGCNAMEVVLLPGDVDDRWLCRHHDEMVYGNRENLAVTPASDE
jgi:hypothetical protein